MSPAGPPARTESETGQAHNAHPQILVAAGAVLLALVLLIAGFAAGSTALLWAAVIAAALGLAVWVADRRAKPAGGVDTAEAGRAIGLLVARRSPTGR